MYEIDPQPILQNMTTGWLKTERFLSRKRVYSP